MRLLSRRREYYVGGRPRSNGRRFLLVALAAMVVLGSAGLIALGGFPPTSLGALVGGASPSPVPVAAASPTPPEPSPTPSVEPSVPPTGRPSPLPSGGCAAAPAGVTPAEVVFNGPRTRKVVALTFDDGTNPTTTRQILAILKREKVNATFFPTGAALRLLPDLWKQIARSKFPLANHTQHHRALAGLCVDAQQAELAAAQDAFDELGIEPLPIMRPPYEAFDDATRIAAGAAGLRDIVLWDVDTRDWEGATQWQITQTALAGGRGSIVLMHTFPAATAAALPAIIRGYRSRGFTFVTLGQLLGIPGPVPFPATGT